MSVFGAVYQGKAQSRGVKLDRSRYIGSFELDIADSSHAANGAICVFSRSARCVNRVVIASRIKKEKALISKWIGVFYRSFNDRAQLLQLCCHFSQTLRRRGERIGGQTASMGRPLASSPCRYTPMRLPPI